jgi:hypothetical protein
VLLSCHTAWPDMGWPDRMQKLVNTRAPLAKPRDQPHLQTQRVMIGAGDVPDNC